MNNNRIRQRLALIAAGAAIVGSFAFASSAVAQDQDQGAARGQQDGRRFDPAQMTERRISRMTETLQLSQSQVTQIRAILTDEHTQMEALRKNGDAQRPDDRAGPPQGNDGNGRPDAGRGGAGGRRELPPEVKAIRDKSESRIAAVLTPQQLSTYRAQQAERAKRGGEQRQGKSSS
jgi:Spy/CpxP family protein refolding chaperone